MPVFGENILKRYSVITIAMAFVLVASCRQKPTTPITIENTVFIDVPFDMAWEAAVTAVMDQMQMPTESVDKERGIILTRYMTYASGSMDTEEELEKIAERPGGWFNIWSGCRFRIEIFLTPVSVFRTAIEIAAHIEVSEGRSGQWQVCRSKGVLEEKVLDTIRSTLD